MGLMSAKENSTCQNLIFEAIDRAKGSKSVGPLHFYYLPCHFDFVVLIKYLARSTQLHLSHVNCERGSKSVGPLHFYYLWRVDARKDKSKVHNYSCQR